MAKGIYCRACLFLAILCGASPGFATIFGTVRGVVFDPQHLPIKGAPVTIRARASEWSRTAQTDAEGRFEFRAVPVGEYVVGVNLSGFTRLEQPVAVTSGAAPILQIQLKLAAVEENVVVSSAAEPLDPASSTTQSIVSREEIARTPGADRSNSLAMITNYVPGAYMVHDQLHIRGGHQVTWLIDGVPVPNTNIASNVGPQFDPKDIDYLEVQRGGYSSEYGDRIYGVFNVVPRSGFERNNEGQLVASIGSFYQTNDQISLGGHTKRFAYYTSVNGNRTDLGLETPAPYVLHDLGAGLGGMASLIFAAGPGDELRLVTSARGDHYQVPNSPEDQAAGVRDVENERDALVNFSWVHTARPGVLATVSPFYHFNRANFIGGAGARPVTPETDHRSQYAGGQVTLAALSGRHNARVGLMGFAQKDNALFGIVAGDQMGLAGLSQREKLAGNVEALFLEDQCRVFSWLTVNGGIRLTHFAGELTENAASPRAGAAIRIPGLGWVVRGFYGRYYQPPPLSTVSGPLLDFALEQGFGFLPLRGERDEQYEAGIAIPFAGWTLDTDYFQTRARNFFDHDVLGNSNIFFPLTIDTARIRGWEAAVRSPLLLRRAKLHLVFSRQFAEGRGAVSGGLTDFTPPEGDFFFLDHDQRTTLGTGFEITFPGRAWASGHVAYGSGFLNGDGPGHLPSHTTLDLSLAKDIGERWSVRLTGLNLTGRRYLLDNSNTFGGTHFNDPRQIIVELKYRFRY